MFCVKCQKELDKCTCPDIDERLEKLSKSPHIIMKWCLKCDKHYSQCRCKEPKWGIKNNRKEILK